MTKKGIAMLVLTIGLGLGVVRAVGNQIAFDYVWETKPEAIEKKSDASKIISLETATSILAFGLAGFCMTNSRKKV